MSRLSVSPPSWSTQTYIASVECETCRWWWDGDASKVEQGRRAGRKHAERNPGHVVRVETGKSTTYGERCPR